MKYRQFFVSNSSSTSFVLDTKTTPERIQQLVFTHCTKIEKDALRYLCQYCDVNDVYYLVGHKPEEEFLHIWVRRDEEMYIDELDDGLRDYCISHDITPKFDYHY